MKFTFNWLKDHLKTNLNYIEISDKLTNLGIEVESITDYSKVLDKIIVGKILVADKHPNADKLHVCKVDVGYKEPLNIVCGAQNARAGIYVAVALEGATIPRDNIILKKGNIRGIESQGMMCSYDELNIENNNNLDGIIELPENSIIGQLAYKALDLDEVVFDVSITPNRADCFSVRGIARDLAAAGCGELINLNINEIEATIDNNIELELETNKCNYFSTLAIDSFDGKTPEFIAKRLKLIDQKLISCPVDIANYICFDIGQPMHIFDRDKLNKKIYIRESKNGEKLKTLNNGKVETLPEGAIVASSDSEVLSLLGIIGGEATAVSNNSKNLLVESSYFDKVSITKAGQYLHIVSDARTRFERGTDPSNVELSIKYFVYLLLKSCPSIKISKVKSVGTLPSNKFCIKLSYNKFKALTNLGQEEFNKSKELFINLGCKILECNKDYINVETPSWRHDLHIEEDLVEEVLRLIGFDKINNTPLEYNPPIMKNDIEDKLLDALIYSGYYEVKTFSLIDKKTAELFTNSKNIVNIADILSNEFAVLRPTLVASHLKAIIQAQNRSQNGLKIAEIGKQFNISNKKIVEENILIETIAEINKKRHWLNNEKLSVFNIKEDLERILSIISSKLRINNKAPDYYHPGRSGSYIYQKDTIIAQFGEIHPSILSNLGIKGTVVTFEVFLDRIDKNKSKKIKKPIVLSQYQLVTRDFSFILDKSITASTLIECINKLHINEIKDINIFDVYESESFGKDKKAIAFEVSLQSNTETLNDEQIQIISDKIINSITVNCNGILRDK